MTFPTTSAGGGTGSNDGRTNGWSASRSGGVAAVFRAACDRMLGLASGAGRERQVRLAGALIAVPFALAPAVAQFLVPAAGTGTGAAGLVATFAVFILLAMRLRTHDAHRLVERCAAAAAILTCAVLAAGLGGASSPAALLLALPAAEAFHVTRDGKAALASTALTVAVFALVSTVLPGGADVAASPAHWLAPALAFAMLGMREHGLAHGRTAVTPQPTEARADLADRINAAVLTVGPQGEVEAASSRTVELLGIVPQLLFGSGLFDRVHVADRVAYKCALAEARAGRSTAGLRLRLRLPDPQGEGQRAYYRRFDAEIVGAPGDAVELILRGDERLIALEDALARARDEAGRIEVAKGRFLATVSHELRTPLNAIIGFSEMLLHRDISGDLAPKQAEQVALIREAGNHLLSVVNAILDVSKIESGAYHINAEPFDLAKAVEMCRTMLEPQAAARSVAVTNRVAAELGEVVADQRAVQQILINLVSNAIKFTPAGGQVSVTATRRGERILVHISDNGIGIAADDLDRLGKPFMQVRNDYTRQFQGTGLGLSLVKGLVQLHGGTMEIESAPGLGTTVTIGLPASTGDAPDKVDETGEDDGFALRKIA